MYPLYVEAAFRNRGSPCSLGCRVSHREEKVWQRERELLEGEARLKDREIAHLTDVADEYKGLYESLYESNSQLVASMEAPPVAEPAADSRELNEYGDVGAR